MPIDPSIALSYQQPKFMTPADALSLKDLALRSRMNEQQARMTEQEMAEQQALRQSLSAPGAIDPTTGMIAPQALQGVAQAAPLQYPKILQGQMSLQNLQADRVAAMNERFVKTRNDLVLRYGGETYKKYQDDLKAYGPEVATRNFQLNMQKAIEDEGKTGVHVPGDLDRLQKGLGSLTPDNLHAMYLHLNPQVATDEREAKKAADKAKEPKSDLGKLKADLEAGRISKKDYDAEVAKKTAPTTAMRTDGGFEGDNGELMAALAERGISLPTGFRSKEQQVALLNGLRKRNPGKNADQIADMVKSGQIDLANLKKMGQVAAGQAGKIAYAENEIKQIVPLVREASLAVPRGQWVPWNRLKQMGETQLSDPNLKEFKAYMTTLSNAYDMLAARGGTDVAKREENRKLFDTADSPEALERVLKAVINEAEASGRAAKAGMDASRGGETDKPKGAPKAYDDPEKEKRYQEWKKANGY